MNEGIYQEDLDKALAILDEHPEIFKKIHHYLPRDKFDLPFWSKIIWKNLTDKEFEIVYNLPLDIGISPSCDLYLENRRKGLGMNAKYTLLKKKR